MSWVLNSSSSRTRRCSIVQPDGPAAAPRRARRRLTSSRRGQIAMTGEERGSSGGSGSRSAASVSDVAGANGEAIKAVKACIKYFFLSLISAKSMKSL